MSEKALAHKGFTGSIETSIEDECLHGQVLFIDDVVTYEGETVPALIQSFKEAVDRYLAYCERTGKAANKAYSGTFNVRTGSELHRQVAKAAHKRGMGLNEYVTHALQAAIDRNGITKIEHVHQHDVTVTVQGGAISEARVVTMKKPLSWEPAHGTIQ